MRPNIEELELNMDVTQAVNSRVSCRAFRPDGVPEAVLSEVLEAAARAPSNGNLQPWRLFVVAGERLELLTRDAVERIMTAGWEEPEYYVYPSPLKEPYRTLRFEVGEALYKTIGVTRDDKAGRQAQFAKNAELFGAPLGLFFYIDRSMSPGQWMDLGMFIQTLMLLFEERGIATCAQGYWTGLHKTLAKHISPPDELMLACGMAVGYADSTAPINALRSDRMAVDEFTTFVS